MTEERPSEVLGSLPRTRPHRRSDKRAARPAPSPAASEAAEAKPAVDPRAKTATPGAAKKPANAKAPAKAKAPARAEAPEKPRLRQPAQPGGTPAASRARGSAPPRPAASSSPRTRTPVPARTQQSGPGRRGKPEGGTDVLTTAVQAAAELAEIGLAVSARAVRRAVSRLPRP